MALVADSPISRQVAVGPEQGRVEQWRTQWVLLLPQRMSQTQRQSEPIRRWGSCFLKPPFAICIKKAEAFMRKEREITIIIINIKSKTWNAEQKHAGRWWLTASHLSTLQRETASGGLAYLLYLDTNIWSLKFIFNIKYSCLKPIWNN